MEIDFSDQKVFEQVENITYDGKLDCTEFPPAEYKYFNELEKIYYAYRTRKISKKDAEIKKRKILNEYKQNKHVFESARNSYKEWNEIIRKSGTYRTEISKADSIESKLSLCVEMIGVLTGDKVFMKKELENLLTKSP